MDHVPLLPANLMKLAVLPTRTAGAAENMAIDFLLLQRYPQPTEARFRHYGWRGPSWTFGYSQKIAFVRGQIPGDSTGEICRRPTGGGVVDHRDDWTYALVIPRGNPLEELRATQSYRVVHECVAAALRAQNVAAEVKSSCDPVGAGADECGPGGVCFQRAELYDVVHVGSGEKIAGAAQKRNKHGLLFQGSIWRPAVGRAELDWDLFGETFVAALAEALGVTAAVTPWPEFNEEEVSALVEQYSSPEWLDFR